MPVPSSIYPNLQGIQQGQTGFAPQQPHGYPSQHTPSHNPRTPLPGILQTPLTSLPGTQLPNSGNENNVNAKMQESQYSPYGRGPMEQQQVPGSGPSMQYGSPGGQYQQYNDSGKTVPTSQGPQYPMGTNMPSSQPNTQQYYNQDGVQLPGNLPQLPNQMGGPQQTPYSTGQPMNMPQPGQPGVPSSMASQPRHPMPTNSSAPSLAGYPKASGGIDQVPGQPMMNSNPFPPNAQHMQTSSMTKDGQSAATNGMPQPQSIARHPMAPTSQSSPQPFQPMGPAFEQPMASNNIPQNPNQPTHPMTPNSTPLSSTAGMEYRQPVTTNKVMSQDQPTMSQAGQQFMSQPMTSIGQPMTSIGQSMPTNSLPPSQPIMQPSSTPQSSGWPSQTQPTLTSAARRQPYSHLQDVAPSSGSVPHQTTITSNYQQPTATSNMPYSGVQPMSTNSGPVPAQPTMISSHQQPTATSNMPYSGVQPMPTSSGLVPQHQPTMTSSHHQPISGNMAFPQGQPMSTNSGPGPPPQAVMTSSHHQYIAGNMPYSQGQPMSTDSSPGPPMSTDNMQQTPEQLTSPAVNSSNAQQASQPMPPSMPYGQPGMTMPYSTPQQQIPTSNYYPPQLTPPTQPTPPHFQQQTGNIYQAGQPVTTLNYAQKPTASSPQSRRPLDYSQQWPTSNLQPGSSMAATNYAQQPVTSVHAQQQQGSMSQQPFPGQPGNSPQMYGQQGVYPPGTHYQQQPQGYNQAPQPNNQQGMYPTGLPETPGMNPASYSVPGTNTIQGQPGVTYPQYPYPQNHAQQGYPTMTSVGNNSTQAYNTSPGNAPPGQTQSPGYPTTSGYSTQNSYSKHNDKVIKTRIEMIDRVLCRATELEPKVFGFNGRRGKVVL